MYDKGTISHHNDSIWNNISNITRGNEYTSIGGITSIVNRFISVSGDINIELDLMSDASINSQILQISKDSMSGTFVNFSLSHLGMSTNEWKHLKITIKDSKLSIDGIGTVYDLGDYNRFHLRASANDNTCFKNLRVYVV